ncbi:MAG: hypothetical protein U9Q29_03795 [Campylobacterota bacterium]|nr:hypothetical protein [Campylobacterota bacterium]
MQEIKLHDIKPIVEIVEPSLYYFLGASFVVILLACGIIYLIYIWLKNRNRFNIRKEHLKLMELLDLNDAKKSAYEMTLYGATFRDDSPRHVEMYKNLNLRLEAYKYKKEVEEFDRETLGYFELYRGMCDV